ncbi:tyrosine phenol-lyase [Candidatus Peregrinibacteria bacterium CG_4_10_14_0_2_um_filter_43_11]|nr:MAG: tyrosine phenol-lyase [Candidatus Peregrinibacteria bacterium CG_4_10_14_0_2_um_filter_43_11]
MDPIQLIQFDTAHQPRAYVNSSVRFHHIFSDADRLQAAKKAGWNVFQFPSEMLLGGDLLSDSGTTTLTAEQVAAMFLGDEAYGSNYGYFKLLESFAEVFGIPQEESEVFLFHQGRAAEHALFTQVGKWGKGMIIPGNGHFDTTQANIECNQMTAVDLFLPELKKSDYHPFKGNMDLERLEALLKEKGDHIPMVYLTITNNTGGGQPVSLENIRAVRKLCDEYGKPLFLDVCRFAENAWFIKNREEQYKNTPIPEIVHETFALCDGFTVSLKKDGLTNMGGALLIKRSSRIIKEHEALLNDLRDHQILTEGHPTYGGMTGRDIMVIAEGLRTVVKEEYLNSRIGQVHAFGEYLEKNNVPVLTPFGGHAVYIDVNRFFEGTKHKPEDFGGVALTALLLLKGVRLCELGAFAFGHWDKEQQKEVLPSNNFVRCAVPRNKYEIQDLLYVADCVIELHKKRHEIPRAVPVHGRELTLRHFKARFELGEIK